MRGGGGCRRAGREEVGYHFLVHALASRLLKTIRKLESLRPGDRVAAGVSGGADSVALLYLLLEVRAELGIVLSVAHVNHKLRGEESEEDQRFVADLARRHGLELHSCEARIDGNVAGIEATARELRYDFFRRLARDGRVNKIATAHTLDDQAETVLLRIFRGTGIRGLTGIHPRIGFEERGRVTGEVVREIVRPLLGFRREALLEFLRHEKRDWREDSSNLDLRFLRNRVRHRLLPTIQEEFGDAALEHLAELAEIARAEEEHWQREHLELRLESAAGNENGNAGVGNPKTREVASLRVEVLRSLSLAARRRLVRAWVERNAPGLSVSFHLIEEALELAGEAAGRKVEMPSGWNLRRGRQELLLEFDRSSEQRDYQYALRLPGAVEVPELRARVEALLVDAGTVPEEARSQLLNREVMPREVVIRNWRAGDRYWPAHTSAEKKVKELLCDRHATGIEKKLWPVAAAEGRGLIWLRGFSVPAAFRAPSGVAQAIWIREIAP